MILFQSDYLEGCHPSVLQKLQETNLEQTPGYGEDKYCMAAADMIRSRFACPAAAIHFLVGGTQVNATVIASALRPFEGVLCADSGHINQHETGAIEASGHKCLALPADEGRITAEQIAAAVALQGNDEHVVKPGMVYISQSTEVGTVYSLAELKAIYATCRELGLYLYIDGARLGAALTSDDCDVKAEDMAACCDAFTIGGTKCGALFGEALIITNPILNRDFRYMIKQHGGMLAKGRMLGLQFMALMEDDLYFKLARRSDELAMRIRDTLTECGFDLMYTTPTNQIFAVFTDAQLAKLSENFMLAFWQKVDSDHSCARICTSWATTEENTDALLAAIRSL